MQCAVRPASSPAARQRRRRWLLPCQASGRRGPLPVPIGLSAGNKGTGDALDDELRCFRQRPQFAGRPEPRRLPHRRTQPGANAPRGGPQVHLPRSPTTSRPLGFKTRAISRSANPGSGTKARTVITVRRSKLCRGTAAARPGDRVNNVRFPSAPSERRRARSCADRDRSRLRAAPPCRKARVSAPSPQPTSSTAQPLISPAWR